MERETPLDTSQKAQKTTGITSSFVTLILLVMVIGAVVAAASFALQQMFVTENQTRLADNSAQAVAAGLTGQVSGYRDFVQHLASDKRIAPLMVAEDSAALQRIADEIAGSAPWLLKLWYLPKDFNETDSGSPLPLSYASLDMANRAVKTRKITRVEFHAPNSPAQHIALAAPIISSNGAVLGAVLMAVSSEPLLQSVQQWQTQGVAFSLVQKAGENRLEMARSAAYDGDADGQLAIEGSIWLLNYQVVDSGSLMDTLIVALTVIVGTLLVLVLLVIKHIQLRKALAFDQQLVLEIARHKLSGSQKNLFNNYALAENQETLKALSQMTASAGADKGGKKPARQAGDDENRPVFPSRVSQASGDGGEVADIDGATISESIFRRYDIRGIVGDTLSLEHAYVIGKAIGSLAIERGENDMLVARDGRVSSKDLSSTLIRGLCESGVNVIDLGLMPTPVMYFGTHFLSARSGVMVTGSHNPPDYNGFKVVIAGRSLSSEEIKGLHGRIVTGRFASGEGSKDQQDISADYIKRISEDVQLIRPMKIIIDCGHGAASVVARSLFEALGCEVVSQYCEVDGNFPAHHPDPGDPQNLQELRHAVVDGQADLGLAFDGDGDRIGVVDSGGKIIMPDRVLMTLATDVLLRNPGADIIYDVKSSKALAAHVLSNGGRPIMWKSGHSLMKAKMLETGALLGGEFSGHVFFSERWYGFDDALYTAARLLEVISGDGRSSAEMFAEIPDSINTPELHVAVTEGMQHTIMEKLQKATDKAFPNAKITDIDGIRAEYPGAWGLIRASNTTPHLVLRFEADSQEAMDKVQSVFRTVLNALLPNTELPF